jgi:hypothetical protein
MNKKMLASALMVIGVSTAFAGMYFPVGSGSVDGTVNKISKIPLKIIEGQSVDYDLTCKVNDANANKLPAKFKVDLTFGDNSFPTSHQYDVKFDDQIIVSHQMLISDNKPHEVTVSGVSGYWFGNNSALVITWLASDDVSTPITFDCSGTPSAGLRSAQK